MIGLKRCCASWLIAIILLSLSGAALAQSAPNKPGTPTWATLPSDEATQRKWFTDLRLLDQDNREVKFYSDVLKDKLVLINFIFTHCQGVCPVISRTFSKTQDLLGERVGKDVFLISVSVDAERDQPAVLKKFAVEYRARPGWTFLTGKKENVDWVIYKLGQWNVNFEAHSPSFMVANVRAGRWQVMRGDATPRQLVAMINEIGKP